MVGQVGEQQLSMIFRREKKVAADIAIVVLVVHINNYLFRNWTAIILKLSDLTVG